MSTPEYSGTDERPAAVPVDAQSTLREDVMEREQEQFGGVKVGSAFFGWLTAVGTGVLLTALTVGIAAAIGIDFAGTLGEAADAAATTEETVALVGGILVIVIMFVAYFSGGYVAGRMARFTGALQGLMVWVWALLVAIVVAAIALLGGDSFELLATVNGLPRIPLGGDVTAPTVITAILVAVAALVGAVLGGMAGMRFHRRVDRVGLGR